MNRRLCIAGTLILIGLLAELLSFAWSSPAAFMSFLLISGAFLLGGMVFFLLSLLSGPPASPPSTR